MTVDVRIGLPTDTVGIADAVAVGESTRVELEPCVYTDGGLTPYLRVETDDPDAFDTALRADRAVETARRHRDDDGTVRYRVTWSFDETDVFSLLRGHGVVLQRAHATACEWVFQLRAPDSAALTDFLDACRDADLSPRVYRSEGVDCRADGTVATADDGTTGSPGAFEGDPPFRQILDNIEEVVWMSDPDKEEIIYVNPAYEAVWGQPRERLSEEPLAFLDAVHPEDRARVRSSLDRQPTGEYDEEYRIRRPDGTTRWIRDRAVSITDDEGNVVRVAGIAEDITERKEREQLRRTLNEAAQAMLGATTSQAVAEISVETAIDALGLTFACVYVPGEEDGTLRPIACAADGETPDDPAAVTGLENPLWESFASGQSTAFDASFAHRLPVPSRVQRGWVEALGEYGVLVFATRSETAFDDRTDRYAGILTAITEVGLGQTEREARLERQNERLSDLSRLNAVIRDINTEVAATTNRDAIEHNVCERFAVEESYLAACICDRSSGDSVRVRRRAGTTESQTDLDGGDHVDAPLISDLIDTATATGTVRVDRDADARGDAGSWYDTFRDAGCRAVVAVPLTSGNVAYGVLLLFIDDPSVFDEEFLTVLGELGQMIGRAIRAAETRKTLLTDTATELEFEVDDAEMFFHAISAEFDCRLDLEGLVPADSDQLVFYVDVEGVPAERLVERAEGAPGITSVRTITGGTDGGLFEFHVVGGSAIQVLAAYGATIRSASADGGVARIVAEIASDIEVRPLVSTLEDACPGATLVRKSELDRPVRTVQQFRESLADRLTDRQVDVLHSAYLSGYFEWPRESTAEDIAASFDVSSSTIHFHLRNALRALLETYYEEDRYRTEA
ncbi:PAS domain-containing protein [Halomicroarcula sp. S1AR25-4]|uniref:bacterio-opsin activator domain-containing protein n=1 Tax=Haloarcula sp. S1AR25-4 TaxID=2950538 RepID=UPI0028752877|nr:bacterio-opsin activator domain-containing protein [Halomicroarcula sp. S1AR25-4]MDS0276940.1 PAS domain-containing protein [Halomicroarcula sp. S1AR25-4]